MTRPRPPLHDPYGLLRPPPPLETPTSVYSTTASSSSTSLPLLARSPNRRVHQRGVSPSRTQQGEEYEDQPYLTNIVRHHGQVTLVPPVNQGRVRKVKRRRNLEATTNTTSSAEVAVQPGSSHETSRMDAGLRQRESDRRPRHGLGSRSVSSPNTLASPYPDDPPPSFEEVLEADRRNASFNSLVPQVSSSDSTIPPRLHISTSPPLLPGPSCGLSSATTPWERDRLLGIGLEERVQREFERSLKCGQIASPHRLMHQTGDTAEASGLSSSAVASISPTSVAGSSFLTPRNPTPPSNAVVSPFEANSSGICSPPRSASPPSVPSKSPDVSCDPATNISNAPVIDSPGLAVRDAPIPSPGLVDSPGMASLGLGSSNYKLISSKRILPHGNPPSSTSRASLLIETKLIADNSLEHEATHETPGYFPSRRDYSQVVSGASPRLNARGNVDGSPPKNTLPLDSAVKPNILLHSEIEDSPKPSKDFTSLPSTSNIPSTIPSCSSSGLNPILASTAPTRTTPSPLQPTLSPPSRRPPPPPPPRPRQRQVGADVAARISAYEALFANAPKVAPPLPPRPRPKSQGSSSLIQESESRPPSDRLEVGIPDTAGANRRIEHPTGEEPYTPTGAHTATPRSRPASRLLDSPTQDLTSRRPPQPRANSAPISGRLPAQPLRVPSPEHLKPNDVQAQALVPARIGSDGRLEIIPNADVIWLDESEGVGPLVPQGEPSSSRIPYEGTGVRPSGIGAVVQPASEVLDPFEDPYSSPDRTSPNIDIVRQLPRATSPEEAPLGTQTPTTGPSMPLLPTNESTEGPSAPAPARFANDFEYTDLDLLISRLEENEAARQGANYEQLLTIGEVLGPALPPAPRPELDLNVGLIEIQRRRVMKDGRVKLKLSLMGVSVDKCGICLSQFKNNESAVLLPCLHSFHTNCIMSWFTRQDVPACPHCRAPVLQ